MKNLIFSIIVLIGVIMVYRARTLAKRYININEENKTVGIIKFAGFCISIIGGILIISFKN